MVDDAARSGAGYALPGDPGRREILYGVSVFGVRDNDAMAALLDRFRTAPHILEFDPTIVQAGGFPVLATGTNEDHYDVQLVPGHTEDGADEATAGELRRAVRRLVALAHTVRVNPAYAGREAPESEEDRWPLAPGPG